MCRFWNFKNQGPKSNPYQIPLQLMNANCCNRRRLVYRWKISFLYVCKLAKILLTALKLEKLNMTLFGYKIWLKIAPRKQFETHFSTFKLSWKSAMHTQSVKYKLDIKRLSIRLKILYHFSSITHSNVFNVLYISYYIYCNLYNTMRDSTLTIFLARFIHNSEISLPYFLHINLKGSCNVHIIFLLLLLSSVIIAITVVGN